jgi:hypothetical protein
MCKHIRRPQFSTTEALVLQYNLLDKSQSEGAMLYTIVVILFVLWLLGAVIVPVGSGLIHLLLVVAVVVLLLRLIQGRRVV